MCFRCCGNLKFPYTYNGDKWKLAFISVLLQIFRQKFYGNVSWVVLYQPYEFCPNHWFWLVAMATERLDFREKKKNLLRSHIAFIAVHSGERCGRWASGSLLQTFLIYFPQALDRGLAQFSNWCRSCPLDISLDIGISLYSNVNVLAVKHRF